MSKFNGADARTARRVGSGFIATKAHKTGVGHEGTVAPDRKAKSELFLAAVSSLVEDTFYESAAAQGSRIGKIVKSVAVSDPEWIVRFVGWLRNGVGLRSVAVQVAVLSVKARLDAKASGFNRDIIAACMARADEPGEVVAAWHALAGRTLPMAVKRGINDGIARLWNERSYLRYKGGSGGFSMADVMALTHPAPKSDADAALFAVMMNDAYGRDGDLSGLPVLAAYKRYMAMDRDAQRDAVLSDPAFVRSAGLSWESVAGTIGLDETVWEALIPNMGYMALLRNLRNFTEAGVSDKVLNEVAARIADPDEVAKSKQMPMRFLSAYRNSHMRFHWPLEQAINASLANVPALHGKSLILCDASGSMWWGISDKSALNRIDSASVFAAALALRSESPTLVRFGTESVEIPVTSNDTVLGLVKKLAVEMGGTNTREAVQKHFKGHDRVVCLTDEQSYGGDPTTAVPAEVPFYTWNLVGYKYGHGATGPNRVTFGGLTDASASVIGLIEAGKNADWPF